MEDKALKQLQDLTPPPPSEKAKRRAIDAACQSFEVSMETAAASENATGFQGLQAIDRFTYSLKNLWRFTLQKQRVLGSAIISVLAISITTFIWQEDDFLTPKPVPPISVGKQEIVEHSGLPRH